MKRIKINWSNCGWARWWAMEEDGRCWFHRYRPRLNNKRNCWTSTWDDKTIFDQEIKDKDLLAHWQASLCKAPSFITELRMKDGKLVSEKKDER